MRTDEAASSAVNKTEKGTPALSEVRTVLQRSCTAELSSACVHSYKSPGKHDGVNYIRTSEEVRAEALWSRRVTEKLPNARNPGAEGLGITVWQLLTSS